MHYAVLCQSGSKPFCRSLSITYSFFCRKWIGQAFSAEKWICNMRLCQSGSKPLCRSFLWFWVNKKINDLLQNFSVKIVAIAYYIFIWFQKHLLITTFGIRSILKHHFVWDTYLIDCSVMQVLKEITAVNNLYFLFYFLANNYCIKKFPLQIWKMSVWRERYLSPKQFGKYSAWSHGLHIRSSFWIGQAFKLQLIFGHIVVKVLVVEYSSIFMNAAHF